MKKAEDWLEMYRNDFVLGRAVILEMIREIQIDAIDATILRCAQLGEIDDGQYYLIAEQLKKELE